MPKVKQFLDWNFFLVRMKRIKIEMDSMWEKVKTIFTVQAAKKLEIFEIAVAEVKCSCLEPFFLIQFSNEQFKDAVRFIATDDEYNGSREHKTN